MFESAEYAPTWANICNFVNMNDYAGNIACLNKPEF